MLRRHLELATPQAKSDEGQGTSLSPSGDKAAGESRVPPGLIPTGSTLLNLALSDDPYGGYPLGSMVNLVGDRDSGKTFLAWNMMAEVVRARDFDKYTLVYDDVEGKLRIPLARLFGQSIGRVDRDNPSDTMEEVYRKVNGMLKKKERFIYVMDSMDALTDKDEKAKEDLERNYPAKPRLFSQFMRKVCGELTKQESFFLVVSQVRDAIGVMFGDKHNRSGGRALGHYCIMEPWLAVKGREKRKEREVGVKVRAKVKKNHLTGKLREVELTILQDYGVDDIGSMIDWLVDEGFWKKAKGASIIDTGGDFPNGARDKIRKYIDDSGKISDLIKITADSWMALEESIKTDLRPRYE